MANPFKPGDKVRLVNEAVAGTVSQIFSASEVGVRDENGFEYRLNILEIVFVIDDSDDIGLKESNTVKENLIEAHSNSIRKYFNDYHSCFLCIVPLNPENLLHSSFSLTIVNASPQPILFSLNEVAEKNTFSFYGIANANEEISAGNLGSQMSISAFQFQLRFVIHSPENKIGHRKFSFKSEDFMDEKLFLSPDLYHRHILTFDLNAKDEMEIPEGEIKKLVDYFTPKEKTISKKSAPIKKISHENSLFTNEKIVDLHVEELTNDYSLMTNAEILSLQFSQFRKELDQAMLNQYYRIIFIHGKGNGILKNRIRVELELMNIKYRDADTGKFGYGATEVLL